MKIHAKYSTFIFIMLFAFFTQNLWAGNDYAIGLDGGESFYLNDNGTGDGANDLDVSSSWTFEAWINVTSKGYDDWECIMDRRTVFSFYLIEDDDNDYAVAFVARSGSDATIAYMDSDGSGSTSANMVYGTWYHVAVTWDGTTAYLYVNSTQHDSSTDSDFGLSSSTNAINFGGRYWGSYSRQMTDAYIDEIRMSNTARAIGDMQTSTSDAAYTSDANTILLMHLDDQDDSPTYVTGTGYNGTRGDDQITSADYVDVSADLSLPVELTSFTANNMRNGTVTLNWVTESEIENLGFLLDRRPETGEWTEIASYVTDNALRGQGSVTYRTEYSYTDETVEQGLSYDYRLADVSYTGIKEYHSLMVLGVDVTNVPSEFTLRAYPNPFNPKTTIRYELPKQDYVMITIYDLLGNKINTLLNEFKEIGTDYTTWDATDAHGNLVSTGIYFCQITAGEFTQTQKIVFMK